jgi:hypothetical protein
MFGANTVAAATLYREMAADIQARNRHGRMVIHRWTAQTTAPLFMGTRETPATLCASISTRGGAFQQA